MSPFPKIQTERLLLRQFRPDDIRNVFRGLSHPEVIRHYGVSYDSLAATRAQMDWFAALEAEETGIWWAICNQETRAFYGALGLNNLAQEHRKAELGFWLLPEHWGKGLIQEALPLVLDYAFTTRNLHRIEAFVERGNGNSQRVLEKQAFRHEGTMEDCEIKNGSFISLDVYALLQSNQPQ